MLIARLLFSVNWIFCRSTEKKCTLFCCYHNRNSLNSLPCDRLQFFSVLRFAFEFDENRRWQIYAQIDNTFSCHFECKWFILVFFTVATREISHTFFLDSHVNSSTDCWIIEREMFSFVFYVFISFYCSSGARSLTQICLFSLDWLHETVRR